MRYLLLSNYLPDAEARQSINQYVRALRGLSKDCKLQAINAVQNSEERIRDVFILDLNTTITQDCALDHAQKNSELYSLSASSLSIANTSATLQIFVFLSATQHNLKRLLNVSLSLNIATHNKDTVISKHFNQTNHNLSMLRISVVQFFTENPKNSRKTDFMRKKYELLWINKLHTYTPISLNIVTHLKSTNIPPHSQIQQFSISTFKTSEKHFIKRHYIPQQIFHHLLIHQSQKLAKHFSTYKILMFNFYSL